MADIARLSGWSWDFILWGLPFSAGLGLLHAEGVFHGAQLSFVHGRDGSVPAHVGVSMAEQLEKIRQRSAAEVDEASS